jgi:hypothetical protein
MQEICIQFQEINKQISYSFKGQCGFIQAEINVRNELKLLVMESFGSHLERIVEEQN